MTVYLTKTGVQCAPKGLISDIQNMVDSIAHASIIRYKLLDQF
jgi:hypothetical protein